MVKLVVLTNVYYVFDEMPKRIKIYEMQNNLHGTLPFSLNLLSYI